MRMSGHFGPRRGALARVLAASAAIVVLSVPGPGNAADPTASDVLCSVRDLTAVLLPGSACPDPDAPSPVPTPTQTAEPKVRPGRAPGSTSDVPSVPSPSAARDVNRIRVTTTPASRAPSPASTTRARAVRVPAAVGSAARQKPVVEHVPWWTQTLLLASAGFMIALGLAGRRRRNRAVAGVVEATQEIETLRRDIVANMGHELITPLTPLKAGATLIASDKLPKGEARMIASQMVAAANQLDRTVELLVGYASLHQGGFDLYREPVDVDRLVRDAVESAAGASTSLHSFHVVSDPTAPSIVLNDRLVRMAVEQLVDNAVKFSPNGGLVKVSVARHDGSVAITVRDQGVGIEPGRLAEIVEPFRQSDTSSTRAFGGTGLGLSFADRAASAYGGRLTVRSQPGFGSAFTLSIPVTAGVLAHSG